jgi:O-antigen ligase
MDLSNGNDLAFHLLFSMAFTLVLLFTRSTAARVVWLATFPIAIIYVLKTGSRANFVTLLAVILIVFYTSSRKVRIRMTLVIPILTLLAVVVVPSGTWSRLSLIVWDPTVARESLDDELIGAVDSQHERTQLQKLAIELTVRHPIFGIGPFMFPDAAEELVRNAGKGKSGWQFPHNCYLQISSEGGIPSLFFYVWSIFLCVRLNYRCYKENRGRSGTALVANQSFCLFLAAVIYAIGVSFCNIAYYAYLSVLVGCSAANYMAIQESKKLERGRT